MEHRRLICLRGLFLYVQPGWLEVLERVQFSTGDVLPIVPEAGAATDTRFGAAHDFMREMERDPWPGGGGGQHRQGRAHWAQASAGCAGLSRTATPRWLGNGVTDTTVTMAAKAHLRNGGPVVICPATNDGLAASARNIGVLLDKKNVYFVPFRQDDPARKPTSLVADFSLVPAAIDAAVLEGRQPSPCCLTAGGGLKHRPRRSWGGVLVIVYRVLAKSMGI